ncbi:hypothetical protein SS05631_c33970 [Sinorhizobium sp. CCBAU 05631]|nr:hypothetical protein SS05631_c33970 [Sinorhizobium sp. CCBAU 05631]
MITAKYPNAVAFLSNEETDVSKTFVSVLPNLLENDYITKNRTAVIVRVFPMLPETSGEGAKSALFASSMQAEIHECRAPRGLVP